MCKESKDVILTRVMIGNSGFFHTVFHLFVENSEAKFGIRLALGMTPNHPGAHEKLSDEAPSGKSTCTHEVRHSIY